MVLQRVVLRFLCAGNFANQIIVNQATIISKRFNVINKTLINQMIKSRWIKKEFTLLTVAPFTAMGILGFMKNKDQDNDRNADIINDKVKLTSQEIILAKADALFDQSEYKEIYEILLNYKDIKNVEFLWRSARALYNMSKTASEVESKKLINEGYDLIATALSIDENHWAVHKWMAILLDAKSNQEGMKARIKQLHTVKNHMMRSTELNPKDATTLYMLGSWCFEISNLAWYQRKMVSAVFGTDARSTFEEALIYFEAAEQAEPNFYSRNLLMLGKTYLKLNKKEDALKYLKKASDYQPKTDEDQESKKEALKILNEL